MAQTNEPPTGPQRGSRTAPDQENTGWPSGIPYIIGNEGCERFSFYGMKSILFVHLVALYVVAGEVAGSARDIATAETHLFISGVYAFPMIGAIIADRLLGKYHTIITLSLVYCAGHAVLAVGENSIVGMHLGLGLIALGAGGIKPCVSAHVGDQFGRKNWFRVRTIFQWFYFIINFGSAFATILIPYLRDVYGAGVAFGVPGVLMLIATLVFWMGRDRFIAVPAHPGGRLGLLDTLSSICLFMAFGHLFVSASAHWTVILGLTLGFLALGLALFAWRQSIEQDDGFLAIVLWALWDKLRRRRPGLRAREQDAETDPLGLLDSRFWGRPARKFGPIATEGPLAVLKIISVFFLVSVFWSLFDQHSSSWIRQAEMMYLPSLPWGGRLLPEQMAAMNPFLVMLLIPTMNLVYRGLERLGFKTSPLRRMTVGMMVAAVSFVAVALIQERIDAVGPHQIHVLWQFVPYLLITSAEVMISITGLEFAYTQAPQRMKSTLMGFWLLTTALGNVLVAVIAKLGNLPLADFFWVFSGLMAAAGLLFAVRARFYHERDYTQ